MRLGIAELYCGKSGKKGYYNSQEIGLARAMKNLGHDIYVFYPDRASKRIQEEKIEDKIHVVYVPAFTIGNHSKYDWKVLLQYQIEAVQIGTDNQIFAPDFLRFCDHHRIKAYDYIGTIHTDSGSVLKKKVMDFFLSRNIKAYKSHKNFAKTKAVQQELMQAGIPDVDVAYVGLDLSVIPSITETKTELRIKNHIPLDKKVLLFVGRLDPYKRPELMVKLIEDLPDNCYGIMIGDGTLSGKIDELINQEGLSDRIKQIKKIPNEQIHQFYKLADYFLNFNEHEIFGMSILEAMYQNCNVIAFHAPGPNEIIEDRKSGFLVSSLSKMEEIISSCSEAQYNAPKDRIQYQFSWLETARKINQYI